MPFAISKAEVFGAIGLRGDQVAERQYDAVIEVPCFVDLVFVVNVDIILPLLLLLVSYCYLQDLH